MWIIDFLAPPSCVFCGVSGEKGESSICRDCYADLPWNEPALSPRRSVFESSVAMLNYSYPIDVAIKSLKFNRKLFYAAALSEILCDGCVLLPDDIDAVLPVPLHWRRKMTRGFNQATELAKPVAKELGVPLLRGVVRQKATPFQSGLKASERSANMKDAFSLRRALTFEHVLIVDDVITTGATLRQLGKLLLRNGVGKVSALAAASAD